MPFYIELPADEYGNRAYTNSFPCVVEAEPFMDQHNVEKLLFIAPSEIAEKWPDCHINDYGGWLEVDGPARPLTWEEREELIKEIMEE